VDRNPLARRVLRAVVMGCAALSLAAGAGQDSARTPVPDTLDGRVYEEMPGARATLYYVPEQRALAERMRAMLDAQPPLPGMPPELPRGVHAVLAHSPAALDALTGGSVPEWRAGVAVPSLDLLIMPTGEGAGALSGEGARTLRHEWAHLGLHQHLGGLRAPRWFNEGYAEFASGGFDAAEAWRLRVGLALRRAPVLDSLTLDWPVRREEARMAYLLSASALFYLVEESGVRGLEIFFERWREAGSFEAAFRATYGVTTGQFEEDWRAHVKRRYGWLFVLAHSSLFWMFLGIMLFFMVRVRRRYNLERIARLRADELPDLPAYWIDDDRPPGEDPPPPDPSDGPRRYFRE